MSRLSRFLSWLLAIVLSYLGSACEAQRISEDDWDAVWNWLTCDECQLEVLEDSGAAPRFSLGTVGVLSEQLQGLSPSQVENMNRRYGDFFRSLPSTGSDEEEFIGRYLENLEASIQMRAAQALGYFEVWDTLEEALEAADAREYRDDVTGKLQTLLATRWNALPGASSGAIVFRILGRSDLNGVPLEQLISLCSEAPRAYFPPRAGLCFSYAGISLGSPVVSGGANDFTLEWLSVPQGVYEASGRPLGVDTTLLVRVLRPNLTDTVLIGY